MPKAKKLSRSQGFSLIEVLISMLILAFGVLSMGGLQLASLRGSQSAANFSVAVTLAKDYTEMMRSNSTVSNNTSTVAGVNPYLFDSASSSTFTATPSVDCKTTACTGAQLSVLHISDWAGRVTSQLPSGRAVVCRDPAPRNADGSYRWSCGTNAGTAVTVKLGWIDKRDKEERGTTTVSITPLAPQLVMGGVTGFAE
jgi:type IV pilus assembly protein PilV